MHGVYTFNTVKAITLFGFIEFSIYRVSMPTDFSQENSLSTRNARSASISSFVRANFFASRCFQGAMGLTLFHLCSPLSFMRSNFLSLCVAWTRSCFGPTDKSPDSSLKRFVPFIFVQIV